MNGKPKLNLKLTQKILTSTIHIYFHGNRSN